MPLFSVLIPSYNRPELIAKTVRSVLSSDYKDFELIVSDDRSPRQTEIVETLRPYL
jgi:glycosyltransferase involved in cell wall biosynthesis